MSVNQQYASLDAGEQAVFNLITSTGDRSGNLPHAQVRKRGLVQRRRSHQRGVRRDGANGSHHQNPAAADRPRTSRGGVSELMLRAAEAVQSCRVSRRGGEDRSHALLHLARDMIVAHEGAAVAQAACLSLHHKHQGRGRPPSPGTRRACLRRWRRARARIGGIELSQPFERNFQRSSHPSERNGLLLCDLITESVDGSAVRAKIAGHA